MHPKAAFPLLALSAFLLAAPGCLIVATDRHYYPTKKELDQTRELSASQPLPTIRTEYHQQLSQLSPGMSIEQFKQLFPQAVFVEQHKEQGETVDIYSVRLDVAYHYRGGDAILNAHDEAWFHFTNNRFTKWSDQK